MWPIALAAGVVVLIVVAVILGYRTGDTDPLGTTDLPAEQTMPSATPGGLDPGVRSGDVDAMGRAIVVPADPAGDVVEQQGPRSDSELANPLAAPQGLEWQRVFGGIVPFSSSDGPTEIDAGVPIGMARTPQGAALAGRQIRTRTMHGPREYRERVLKECTSAGPSTTQAILTAGDAVGDDLQIARSYAIPAAFRIEDGNFSQNAATIEYAFGPMSKNSGLEAGEPYYSVKTETVIWKDGAWQLAIDGSLQEDITISSIEGWTSWF